MKKILLLFVLLVFTIAASAQKAITCLIKTTLGNIAVELYPKKAPITVANFLKYVDAHLYDSSCFFRAVNLYNQPKDSIKIEVIQGGNVDSTKEFAHIPLESTYKTGVLHTDGAISMARGKPATATSSFFICINDQPHFFHWFSDHRGLCLPKPRAPHGDRSWASRPHCSPRARWKTLVIPANANDATRSKCARRCARAQTLRGRPGRRTHVGVQALACSLHGI